MPGVGEGGALGSLAHASEALGQRLDRDALDLGRPAGERPEPKHRGQDDPREAVSAAGQLEDLGLLFAIAAQRAEAGMEERDVHHGASEGPLLLRVLAVYVRNDAAADGDGRVAGLNRQDQSPRRNECELLLEAHPGLDLDQLLRRREADHAVEPRHVQDQAAATELAAA